MNMLNKFIDVYNSGTHKKYKEYIKVYNLKKKHSTVCERYYSM